MVETVKKAGRNTKRALENAYEVLAMACAVAAAIKVSTAPHANNLPVWQVVAGVLFAGVAYRIFNLMNRNQ